MWYWTLFFLLLMARARLSLAAVLSLVGQMGKDGGPLQEENFRQRQEEDRQGSKETDLHAANAADFHTVT